jgi:hypothetical protein
MRIFEPEIKECPVCGRFLCKKYHGAPRTVMTLKGSIEAQEHVKQCKKKTCPNYGRSIRSAELQSIVLPHMKYGIDVVAHAGELRFYDHLTLDEVIEELAKHGFKISNGEMSFIVDKFLALLAGVHEEKIPEIRKSLEKNGFVLSIDGTVSIKGKTLYIFRDTMSSTVLFSEVCEIDDTTHIESMLKHVVESFGVPLAVISDMQKSIIDGVKNVLPGVPHQFCQYHFLRNVGNALTKDLHEDLGKEMKRLGVRAEIKSIQKKMNEKKRSESKVDIRTLPLPKSYN